MPKIYAKMVDLDTAADTVDDLPADATPFECIDLMKSCPGYQLEVSEAPLSRFLLTQADTKMCQGIVASTRIGCEPGRTAAHG